MISLSGQRGVPIRAFRQPEVHGVISEVDWSVFDKLVIAHQANLGNRAHGIGFDGEDLRIRGVNPRSAFQPDRISLAANAIDEHCAFTVSSLLKMNHPGRLAPPRSAALAGKFVFLLVIGVKNESYRGKTNGADMPREFLCGNRSVAVFLNIQIVIAKLANFDHVVKLPGFLGDLQTKRAEAVMVDSFCGGETVHILNEFLYAIAGSLDYIVQLAGGAGIQNQFLLIDIGRDPVGFGDGCNRRQVLQCTS